MNNITVIGIDLAKNVIQIHGTNDRGKKMLKKRIHRNGFLAFMANLPKCLVGMEACGGAHHWGRELVKLGFEVKLMSPTKVKKYADAHIKNDERDAEACAEAVTRAHMRFVAIKTEVQSSIQNLHRARSFYVKQRTALMNMTRGLLLEFGINIPKGQTHLEKTLRDFMYEENQVLSGEVKMMFQRLKEDLEKIEKEVVFYTDEIEKLAKKDEACRRLQTIEGVGSLSATAIVAKIGNSSEFQKGRELSAFLGLVPKQHSSGEKQVLGSITKHGDRYLRQLLVHGGRSCVKAAFRINKITGTYFKQDAHNAWIRSLVDRVGKNKASVAVANKNARMMVALLKNKTTFVAELAHEKKVG